MTDSMKKQKYVLSSGTVEMYFDAAFNQLTKLVDKKNAVIVTDENIFSKHRSKFKNWNVITLKPGEQYKIQLTADAIIEQLIEFQADRSTTLIGVGEVSSQILQAMSHLYTCEEFDLVLFLQHCSPWWTHPSAVKMVWM